MACFRGNPKAIPARCRSFLQEVMARKIFDREVSLAPHLAAAMPSCSAPACDPLRDVETR